MLSPSNNIAGVGGRAIAKLLTRECALEAVDLDDNRVGDEGGCAIADALRVNTNLRSYVSRHAGHLSTHAARSHTRVRGCGHRLTLRNNSIEDDGLAAIAAALEESGTIMQLALWVRCLARWVWPCGGAATDTLRTMDGTTAHCT